jgi:hypothetical protein
MTAAITIYLVIGAIVNMHLHLKNSKQISSIVTSGYVGAMFVLLTGMLNHLIWPLALYLDNKDNKL